MAHGTTALIVLDQTPRELFRELVAGALTHRKLRVRESTEFYLVRLLEREGPLPVERAERLLAADLHGEVEHVQAVGSTVTVLAHLFMERGIAPGADEATMMMLGLYEDTGSLTFATTTAADYQAAAFLLEHGASALRVEETMELVEIGRAHV